MDTKRLKRRFAIEWIIVLTIILSCFLIGNVKYGIEFFVPSPEIQQPRYDAEAFLSGPPGSKPEDFKIETKVRYWATVSDFMVLAPVIWLVVLFVRITVWSIRVVKSKENI